MRRRARMPDATVYPIQRLLADKALAVLSRIEKGKGPPGLDAAECYCRSFTDHLMPCRHIFHEPFYGANKLLTAQAWLDFQEMFAKLATPYMKLASELRSCNLRQGSIVNRRFAARYERDNREDSRCFLESIRRRRQCKHNGIFAGNTGGY